MLEVCSKAGLSSVSPAMRLLDTKAAAATSLLEFSNFSDYVISRYETCPRASHVSSFDLIANASRLTALDDYQILDTPPEQGFDEIVQIARHICSAPVSLVSLVAANRQWFKAKSGFTPCETDLNSSVCSFALSEPDLLVIPDLSQDSRTRQNPLVTGDPFIRFYAGAPLRTAEGQTIGSLCVIDTKPRPTGLAPREADALRALARQVMSQLDLRRAVLDRISAEVRRNGLLELGDRLRDLSTPAEMVKAASEILGKSLSASRVGYGELDNEFETVTIIDDWTDGTVESIAGVHRFSDYGRLRNDLIDKRPLIIENVDTDSRTSGDPTLLRALGIAALINVVVSDRGRPLAIIFVHSSKPRRWPNELVIYVRNIADRLEFGIARLRAQKEQLLLNEELSHRMKNTMAVIQAIASQTLRDVPDQAPVEAFTKRLHALSSAHDVLISGTSASADVGDIIRSVLLTFGHDEQCHLAGPRLEFGPRAALSLALLVHELATNAVKYGALSADGIVRLTWKIEDGDFDMHWVERGGPPASIPTSNGFGSRLIRMGLIGTGRVETTYSSEGFEGKFAAPAAQTRN